MVAQLTSAEELSWGFEEPSRQDALALVGGGFEACVYIRDMIDVSAAISRFEKSIGKESKALEQTNRKLSNEGFLKKAGGEIVEKERRKQAEMERKIEKMRAYIEDLRR